MSEGRREPHFAAHCELQDASRSLGAIDLAAVPMAASIEIAKILTIFDGQIDDDWRALLIDLGGALIRLDRQRSGT
jgi:hypothetical protein